MASDKNLVSYDTNFFCIPYLTPGFIFYSFFDTYVPYLTLGYIFHSFLDTRQRDTFTLILSSDIYSEFHVVASSAKVLVIYGKIYRNCHNKIE